VLGLVLAAAIFFVLTGLSMVLGRNPVARRLDPEAPSQRAGMAITGGKAIRHGPDSRKNVAFVKVLQRLGDKMLSRDTSKAESNSTLRTRLIRAGYYALGAVSMYYAMRLVMAIGLPLIFSVSVPLLGTGLEANELLMGAILAGLFGAYSPAMWLFLRIRSRQRRAREGFPDALDMLLVCVEAGMGLDASIDRVGVEIARAHAMLAEQFVIIGAELRAGMRREDALRNLSERIGIEEVGSMVTMLLQSERLGTSLAQTLRVHADEMRGKRMMRAEEKANKLPVLLSVPLVICILPALMIVVLSPAIIRVLRDLLPSMAGR
jgi:tight adherence protein C